MFNMLKKIIKYPRMTSKYPAEPMDTSRFIGKPVIDQDKCQTCGECIKACPSEAILTNLFTGLIGINLDECIFCARCADICSFNAITITHEFEIAEFKRNQLRHSPLILEEPAIPDADYQVIGRKVKKKVKQIFGRSLQIREVDAGSCNACDYEINALNNPLNDIERFGINFVASPRHADMLLVTGPGTRNMELALIKTYNATPDPKLVVAIGACACSGGIFRDSYVTRNGIDEIIPVDMYVPGCPPRPQAILYGILKALERI